MDKQVKQDTDIRLALVRALIEQGHDLADVFVDGKPYHPSGPAWWEKSPPDDPKSKQNNKAR